MLTGSGAFKEERDGGGSREGAGAGAGVGEEQEQEQEQEQKEQEQGAEWFCFEHQRDKMLQVSALCAQAFFSKSANLHTIKDIFG